MAFLECGSSTVEGVVDLVNNVGSTNSAVVEVAAVKTLEGLLTTSDRVELDKDISLRIGVNGDVNDFAVLGVAFSLDFRLKILRPISTILL